MNEQIMIKGMEDRQSERWWKIDWGRSKKFEDKNSETVKSRNHSI